MNRYVGYRLIVVTALLSIVATAVAAQTEANWRVSPQPIVSIGEEDGELFSRIADAIRLPDGRFVIADGNELRISVYDAQGRHQARFGRRGDGPGELRSISGIWNTGGNIISVWDGFARRFTQFRPDGSVVRVDRVQLNNDVPPAQGTLDAFMGVARDGRIVLAWIAATSAPGKPGADRMTFGLFEPDGRFVRTIGTGNGMIRLHTQNSRGPFVFSPFPSSGMATNTLLYTDGLDGVIHSYDLATPGHNARVTVQGRAAPLDAAWRAFDRAKAEHKGVGLDHAEAIDRSIGKVPHFARMFTDDAGRLWLKEYQPARDAMPFRNGRFLFGGQWRVVNPNGTPVARITIPEHIAPIAVHGDQLLGVARDEFDVESFVVYRIVR